MPGLEDRLNTRHNLKGEVSLLLTLAREKDEDVYEEEVEMMEMCPEKFQDFKGDRADVSQIAEDGGPCPLSQPWGGWDGHHRWGLGQVAAGQDGWLHSQMEWGGG